MVGNGTLLSVFTSGKHDWKMSVLSSRVLAASVLTASLSSSSLAVLFDRAIYPLCQRAWMDMGILWCWEVLFHTQETSGKTAGLALWSPCDRLSQSSLFLWTAAFVDVLVRSKIANENTYVELSHFTR